ncbi:centrosomal protein of 44 kDa-like isoform X1 [Poecilia latipinna]|uniref:Centrosomal protein of 44 kDa n=1 Tax=Poecilia latipinna TaxID=48699 RepID=A0A3B3UXI2_9TELE|nr:PREDICTED: centrosomal protein of 44 kDa isoform X1 [Poecilia latipinna]XP_014902028.1 PREDICTED: centrosomal protein of 44 kDa-like isoform X1 [Poecilia latipinna]
MLSAGNVQSCLRKLEALLRVIKYPSDVDYSGLSKGDPSSFLPIVSFTLTTFSPPFAEQLVAAGLELSGKTDLRFTDTLYKVLRDIFHYKPILTKEQFLQWGFSQRKISFICDIINLVLQRHKQLHKPKVRYPTKHNIRKKSHLTLTDADAASKNPFVEDHRRNPFYFAYPAKRDTFSADNEGSAYRSEISPSGSSEIPAPDEEESKESFLNSSKVEGRLSALENNIDTLMSAFNKLNILEKRLEELELKNENKNDEDVVMVPKESWENLMSRVVLLEAKLELRDTQLNASSPAEPLTSSLSAVDSSQKDLKESLQRIANMMKETSSLLKNKESCSILHLNSDSGVTS